MEENPTAELILAEEQAVINRGVGLLQEVEMAFDVGKATEGTLILTNLRLVYVHGAEREVDIRTGLLPLGAPTGKRLIFSDVEELDSIPADPANFSISLDSVVSVAGHHKPAMAPNLEVRWTEGGETKITEFVEQITGSSRRRNLNDWAAVIEKLKSRQIKIRTPPPLPDRNSLEGRVFHILGDMQEKGLISIEREVEERFAVDLDPDEVEEACGRLAGKGLLRKIGAPGEDPFYQKISPLDTEDLDE